MDIFFEFINPYRAGIMLMILIAGIAAVIYVCMDILNSISNEMDE